VEKYLNRLYIEGTSNPVALSTLQGILPLLSIQEIYSNIPDRFAAPNIRGELPMPQPLILAQPPKISSHVHLIWLSQWMPWLLLVGCLTLALFGWMYFSAFTTMEQLSQLIYVTFLILFAMVTECSFFRKSLARFLFSLASLVFRQTPALFLGALSLFLLMLHRHQTIKVQDWRIQNPGTNWECLEVFFHTLPLWVMLLLSLVAGILALFSTIPENRYVRRGVCSLYAMLYPCGSYFLIQALTHPGWAGALSLALLAAGITLVTWERKDIAETIYFMGTVITFFIIGTCAFLTSGIFGIVVFSICIIAIGGVAGSIAGIVMGVVIIGIVIVGIFGGMSVGIFFFIIIGILSIDQTSPARFQFCRWFFPLLLSALWLTYYSVRLMPS